MALREVSRGPCFSHTKAEVLTPYKYKVSVSYEVGFAETTSQQARTSCWDVLCGAKAGSQNLHLRRRAIRCHRLVSPQLLELGFDQISSHLSNWDRPPQTAAPKQVAPPVNFMTPRLLD